MTRSSGYMNYVLFRDIADQVSQHRYRALRIVGLGEPALHPAIEDILNYLKRTCDNLELCTDGILLEKLGPKAVLDSGIDYLSISVDGFENISYDKRRPGGNYAKLRSNIIELWNLKKERGGKRPLIRIRHVAFPGDTEAQLNGYRDNWSAYCDNVTFNKYKPPTLGNYSAPYNQCRDIKKYMRVNCNGDVPLCRHQCAFQERK